MSVASQPVALEEEGLRLDRWFRRHFPALSHGRLERLLRQGQVRVDGKRVKAGYRLAPGQAVRLPPEVGAADGNVRGRPKAATPKLQARDRKALQDMVLHLDASVVVIDKPAGLAVQGGTAITRNLDAMLAALQFEAAAPPKLVHRLDKDTSGVLVLARTPSAAAHLARSFREKQAVKTYWAVVAGVPPEDKGRIDLPLAKRPGADGERVRVAGQGAKSAVTDFAVIDRAGGEASWLALRPETGRTHQLRAHAAAIGTPILGDGKYGRRQAFLEGLALGEGLHLHAWRLSLPHPGGGDLEIRAPLPRRMAKTFKALGFAAADYVDYFAA